MQAQSWLHNEGRNYPSSACLFGYCNPDCSWRARFDNPDCSWRARFEFDLPDWHAALHPMLLHRIEPAKHRPIL